MIINFSHKILFLSLIFAMSACSTLSGKRESIDGKWKKTDSICEGGEPDEAVQYSRDMVTQGMVVDTLSIKGDKVRSTFFAWNGPAKTGSCTTETLQTWEFKNNSYRVKEFSLLSQKESGTEKCPPPLDTPSPTKWMEFEVRGNKLRFILARPTSKTTADSSGTVTACGGGTWVDVYERTK